MSNKSLPIALATLMLCTGIMYAQEKSMRILTIEEMHNLAEQNSKVIQTQSIALDEAKQAVREARNGRLPEIDLSIGGSYLGDGCIIDRNLGGGMNAPMPHWGNNFAVEAMQVIYGGGAITNGIAIAKLQEEMAGIGLDASRSNIKFMLTGFYLNLFKLQNIIKVYDKNILLAQQLIQDTKERNVQGIALDNDITRYELRLQNLELERIKAINQAEILNADIVTVLDFPSGTYIIPDSTLITRTLPVESEGYWQDNAMENAFALQQSALAVKIGERAEKIARAERLPQVALVAANNFNGPITIEVPVIDKNFNYWYVGLGINFKISSLYKSGKTIKRTRLATDKLQREYENMQEQTAIAVKADYIKYLEAYTEVKTQEKSVELARSNYDVISVRYANDIALVTDMIDAANQRLNAELQLVNARINTVFNYYKLKNTTGK